MESSTVTKRSLLTANAGDSPSGEHNVDRLAFEHDILELSVVSLAAVSLGLEVADFNLLRLGNKTGPILLSKRSRASLPKAGYNKVFRYWT
jgi:hypothetical protein